MKFTTLLVAALTLIFAAPLAQAEDGAASDKARKHHPHAKKKLAEKFDGDGDGQLNEEEREALRAFLEEKRAEHGDGEGRKGQGRRQGDGERREEVIARFDADGDGQLNEEERAAAKAAISERRDERQAKFKEKHPKLFARIDKDGDGELSKEEWMRAKHWIQNHRGQKGERGEREGKRRGAGAGDAD